MGRTHQTVCFQALLFSFGAPLSTTEVNNLNPPGVFIPGVFIVDDVLQFHITVKDTIIVKGLATERAKAMPPRTP